MSDKAMYDLNVILAPNLTDTQLQTEKDAISAQIERIEGELVELDEWGSKRLAYPIRKGNEGYYLIYKVNLPSERPKSIEYNLRQRDNVMRTLVVKHRPDWRTAKSKQESPQAAAND